MEKRTTIPRPNTPVESRGFSLIEVTISLLLFSFPALTISASVTNALRKDTISENLIQATILAQHKLEEVSSGFGARSDSDIPRLGFERTWTRPASAPPRGTAPAEATVSWVYPRPHTTSVATIVNE